MKATEFKKFIKLAVKEAFQEELKEILLEAVRNPKQYAVAPVMETQVSQPIAGVEKTAAPAMGSSNAREMYQNILNETYQKETSPVGDFRPGSRFDPVNGQLPEGNVTMDQISQFIPG